MDASNMVSLYDDEKIVKDHLKQASKHRASVRSEPDKREEHNIQAGFDRVGKARGILAESPVQPMSFGRH
jgi:hypothetical protein